MRESNGYDVLFVKQELNIISVKSVLIKQEKATVVISNTHCITQQIFLLMQILALKELILLILKFFIRSDFSYDSDVK